MIAAFDRAAVRRIGQTDSRLLDPVMPRLSRLANRRLLWIGVASVLRATGGAGLTARQGPHRGAHMSTTTGMAAASATSANVSSPAAATQGSGLWQLPHRGFRARRPEPGSSGRSSRT